MKSQQFFGWIRRNLLVVSTIAAVVLGAVFGLLVRKTHPSKHAIMLLAFPGEILMCMLKVPSCLPPF
jgi:hypothetical protein